MGVGKDRRTPIFDAGDVPPLPMETMEEIPHPEQREVAESSTVVEDEPLEVVGAQIDPYAPIGELHSFSEPAFMPGITKDEMDLAIETMKLEFEARFQSALDEIRSEAASRNDGISAQLVGAQFKCPECGQSLMGGSATGQHLKAGMAAYEHPFTESPHIGNKACTLKGKKFMPPVIHLQFR